ncbi:MAG: LysM peptidoglycan-binding domain-containing protein [Gammaproteobacteria bacterium]|nr:LysM peptidoglycan-binding domain-containing protein [Gammaproteobacteria bacterium]
MAPLEASQSRLSASQHTGDYRVQAKDTLWSIANRFRPDSTVSVEQMMLALLRENPEAFIDENIFGLKRGYVLRMPDMHSITSVDQQQALAQVKKHRALWHEASQSQLAAGNGNVSAVERDSQSNISDGDGSNIEDHSAGEDSTAEMARLRAQLSQAREARESERREKQDISKRINDLEKRVSRALVKEDSGPADLQPFEDRVASRRPASMERPAPLPLMDESSSMMKDSAPMTDEMAADEVEAVSPVSELHSAEDNNELVYDKYNVVLGADKKLELPGLPGELRIWIGDPDVKPDVPDEMTRDAAIIDATGGWAKVKPFSTAFKFDPEESDCIEIHPTGSTVRFKLLPQKSGVFEVGADVNLYHSSTCEGSAIPKPAASLKVTVEVDGLEMFLGKIYELWVIFWAKFLDFWAAFLVISFGLIIFLYRKKLKQKFGYSDE